MAAIGTTNILMNQIRTMIGVTALANNSLNSLFSYSNEALINGEEATFQAGNYHNISMGLSGSSTYGQAIYNPYTDTNVYGGLNLSNFSGYDHEDANARMTFAITNNSSVDSISVDLYFSSIQGLQDTILFYSNTIAAGGSDTQTNYDTGVMAWRTLRNLTFGGKYWIAMIATPSGSTLRYMDVIAVSDSDNLGQGLTRTSYTDINGTFNFTSGSFYNWLVAGQGSPYGIPWNKRTDFDIIFYD